MLARASTVALLVALVGCGEEPASTPPPPSEPPPTPESPEPADEPRPPRGAPPSACDGRSLDPPELDLIAAEGAEGDPGAAIEALEALAGAHAGSATARVRIGELLLRARPPAPERAERWFGRALALHLGGCALGPRDHWATLEGAALASMMQGDYEAALPLLQTSLERWPTIRATRYNLACARCQTGDLDGCAAALARALDPQAAPGPDFLEGQRRPAAHYRRLARRDPDLAPLREDEARFEAILAE